MSYKTQCEGEMADDRLNQVIELSSPLRPGQGTGQMKD
jgi:hypothetical protein